MNIETIWAIAGLLLIIADVIFGTFFMLFLGVGALLTASLCWTGVIDHQPTAQWLVFSASSALGVLLFRKKLVKAFGRDGEDRYQEHKGNVVIVSVEIPENGTGRVKYRGAEWPAKTVSGETLAEGSKAMIESTNGIELNVIPV